MSCHVKFPPVSAPGVYFLPFLYKSFVFHSSCPILPSHIPTLLTHLFPMDSSALVNRPCLLCGKTTSMWCGRCQRVWYCTPEHLQADWQRHRKECVPSSVSPSQHRLSAVPSGQQQQQQQRQYATIFGLLFSPQNERPRTVQVNCRLPQPLSAACPTPIVHDFFPDGQPYAVILTQGLNGEPLRFPLHIFYCPQSLARGAPINNAIRRITGGAQSAKPWCGPVVVLKFSGSRRQSYAEASANDFPALSAYFLSYK